MPPWVDYPWRPEEPPEVGRSLVMDDVNKVPFFREPAGNANVRYHKRVAIDACIMLHILCVCVCVCRDQI
jgi:hypothetical protein